MFGNSDKRHKKRRAVKIQTLIGQHTEIIGDIHFEGGLHVDGTIKGNIYAAEGSNGMLTLSEHGLIQGEVWVHHVVLNGAVSGDVHALERIELDTHARVTGNVYYKLIEMAMGAAVNGSLVHRSDDSEEAAARQVAAQSAEPTRSSLPHSAGEDPGEDEDKS